MIAIIDVGICNAASIANMLRIIGVEALQTASPDIIRQASHLILPGIGAFDTGYDNLMRSGLIPLLEQRVLRDKIPVLGICLGMQLMTASSDEGHKAGLGWINATTRRFTFPSASELRIPHMGWNNVRFRADSPLAVKMPIPSRFYFVHSFHVVLENEEDDILCDTTYGCRFASGFSVKNIHGVQFHPEKSHRYGIQFLKNFSNLNA